MCEESKYLIAWLDHEVPEHRASEIERHLPACPECLALVSRYEGVSSAFALYCRALAGPRVRRRNSAWKWIAAAAAAVALGVVIRPGNHVDHLALRPPAAIEAPGFAFHRTPVAVRRTGVPKRARQVAAQRANPLRLTEPEIQVVIPAEDLFPPGAVPAGFQFIADVSIAADGLPQIIRLRP